MECEYPVLHPLASAIRRPVAPKGDTSAVAISDQWWAGTQERHRRIGRFTWLEETIAMPHARPATSRILAAIRAHAHRLGTNPYRIARSSGMSLTTVQRLLSIPINVPLRNVEVLMEVLGLDYDIVPFRDPIWLTIPGPRGFRRTKAKRQASPRGQ
jgi:hypothetical protein